LIESSENYIRDKHKPNRTQKQTKPERTQSKPRTQIRTIKTPEQSKMSSTNSVAATMALRFKEYIANMPDTFDTKKEIDEYIKVGLNNIVKEMKAVEKRPMKKAKKNDDTKMDDADTVNAAKAAEKAEKEAEKAKKVAEKEAEKAKKAAEKEAEKAKKAAEKEAEKAKKAKEAAEKEAEKSNTDDVNDADYVPPKRRPTKKEKKEKVEKSDSDTDDVKSDDEKPKKPPTERKIFFDEMRIKIKELFPDLNSQQTTKKITDLWKTKQDREQGINTYY